METQASRRFWAKKVNYSSYNRKVFTYHQYRLSKNNRLERPYNKKITIQGIKTWKRKIINE